MVTGGIAGKGGNIKVSSNCKVYAFNGNLYTNGTNYGDGINQAPIYLQAGCSPARAEVTEIDNNVSGDAKSYNYCNGWHLEIVSAEKKSGIAKSGYINSIYSENTNFKSKKIININTLLGITANTLLNSTDMSNQGIGSGAGYVELSNGTYTIDESLN